MVAQVGALRVAVGADITGLQVGMKRAERQVQQTAGVMQRAVGGINNSLKGLGTVAGVSLGAAGLLAGARAFLSVADAAKTMSAQLKLATAEYGSFARAEKDVRDIAEKSRSSLTATAELYATIQRNAGELGNTQAVTARVTETVSKSFAVFGTSAMQAEQATRQLVQAFQSGRLQGDEFRSLMENAPRLVKMLADSLGVTTGALRKMSAEGELTADKLLKAFSDTKLTAQLDKEFAAIPVTFDQAMTGVYNAAIVTFSAFDRGGQFSNSIAKLVRDGTEGFSSLEQAAFDFGRGVSDLFTALDQIRATFASLHTDGVGAFSGLISTSYSWRDALADVLSVLDGVINRLANLANFPGNVIRLGMGAEPIVNPSNMRGGFLEAIRDKRSGTDRFTGLFRGGTGRTPPPFRPPATAGKKAKKPKAPPRDRSADVTYQFENELRQAQMDILRAQQQLSHDYVERTTISLQMLDLEKQGRDAEIADRVRRAERDAAEGKITQDTLRQVKIHAATLRAESDKQDAIERQTILAEQEAQRYEDSVRLDALTLELNEKKLQGEAQLADTAQEQRDIQLRLLNLSYQQERARYEAVIADQQASDAAKEDARRRLASLKETYGNDRQAVLRSTRGPLEEWAASIPKTAAQIKEAFQSIEAQGLDSLSDAIADVITGTKKLGDAFADVAKSIIADLIKMSVRMLIFRGLSSVLGGAFGGNLSGSISGGGSVDLTGLPQFATGGSFNILGRKGRDNNTLSLNGLPIARVSHGERLSIGEANSGGGLSRVVVELRDEMLDARIADGANVRIMRTYPILQAGALNAARERSRRA